MYKGSVATLENICFCGLPTRHKPPKLTEHTNISLKSFIGLFSSGLRFYDCAT
jgi:hypothetical protein